MNRKSSYCAGLALSLITAAMIGFGYPSDAYASASPSVCVNGTVMRQTDVIGSTGTDFAVKAGSFLQASGASVRFDNGKLEASWPNGSMLTLTVGAPTCIYNGQEKKLQVPAGMYENDLVVQLKELCAIIDAGVQDSGKQLLISYNSGASQNNVQAASATASLPPLDYRMSAKSAYLSSISGGQMPGSAAAGTMQMGGTMPSMQMGGTIPAMQSPAMQMGGVNARTMQSPAQQQSTAGTQQNPAGGTSQAADTGLYSNIQQPYTPYTMQNKAFPEAGLGGLSSKDAKSSPYERPVVSVTPMGDRQITTEVPRTIDEISGGNMTGSSPAYTMGGAPVYNMGNAQQSTSVSKDSSIAYSSAKSHKSNKGSYNDAAPKAVVSSLDVQRQMSFHVTTYEMKAKIRNDGNEAFTEPFMVKFMVRGEKQKYWDLVENYLINPLLPGQEVEISKRIDGHQFSCLTGLRVHFKAAVLEEVPTVSGAGTAQPKHKRSGKNAQRSSEEAPTILVKEGSTLEKEMRF